MKDETIVKMEEKSSEKPNQSNLNQLAKIEKLVGIFTLTTVVCILAKTIGVFSWVSSLVKGKEDQNDVLAMVHENENPLTQFGQPLTEKKEEIQEILSPAILKEQKESDLKLAGFEELQVTDVNRIIRTGAPPVLIKNTLHVDKGMSMILTPDNLQAIDRDDGNHTLLFMVDNVQHGQFEKVNVPGVRQVTFNQQIVMDGNICFIHDDSNVVPSYTVQVTDGTSTTDTEYAEITLSGFVPFTDESRVNTYTINVQETPSVDILADGKYVIAWRSCHDNGIYCQIYNGDGSPYGNEFRVNTYTAGAQYFPHVNSLNDGKFIVMRYGGGLDDIGGVYCQIYTANGIPYGNEFLINNNIPEDQRLSYTGHEGASLSDGKFVTAWKESSSSQYDVFARIYDIIGNPYTDSFKVNYYVTNNQIDISVSSLNDGKFVATWQSGATSIDESIRCKIYYNNGTVYKNDFLVYDTNNNYSPVIASLSEENFIIVWDSETTPPYYNVHAQIYDTNGTIYKNAFKVSDYVTNIRNYVGVANLSNDKFSIIWSGKGSSDDSGIYCQIFNQDGTRYGREFLINEYIPGTQRIYGNSIVRLSNNKFLVVWSGPGNDDSSGGIYQRKFGLDFSPLLSKNRLVINEGNKEVDITTDHLYIVDPDTDDSNLLFNINTTYGQFEYKDYPGIPITNFTQQQVIDGDVKFVCDNSTNIPQYNISVSDGMLYTSLIPSMINFVNFSSSATSSLLTTSNIMPSSISFSNLSSSSSLSTTSNVLSSNISVSNLSSISSLPSMSFYISQTVGFSSTSSKSIDKKNNTAAIVGGMLGGLFFVVCMGGTIVFIVLRCNKHLDKDISLKSVEVVGSDKKVSSGFYTPNEHVPMSFGTNASFGQQSSNLPTLPEGSLISKEELGRGSSGVVYKAIWNGTTEVAVKQLPGCMLEDEQTVMKFEQEAMLMKDFRHPNVITFYGIYKEPSYYAIVMEYMSQGSLDKLLYNYNIELSFIPTRWQIVEDFTSGLEYLHSQGFAHRDVKSGNLLVYIRDGVYRVKITDFGISKQFSQQMDRSNTRGAGTPIYMSPESFILGKYDLYKSDVHSFGIVLWEIFTRNEPYSDVENQWDIPRRITDGDRPVIPYDCPEMYSNLIQWCWNPKPEDRPTMQNVINNLPEIKEGITVRPT